MTDRLGNRHKAALFALMAVAREVSNSELRDLAGFSITGDVRQRLIEEGYVASRKQGRTFVHELTDKGWARCAEELVADCPPGVGSLGNALYVILGGIDRYIQRNKLRLADVFQPPSGEGLEAQILAAYWKLASKQRDWVRLIDLRPLLNGAGKDDVDRVLKEMSRAGQVHLAPDSNRKALSDVDHAAAIRAGGEDKHLLAIEES